MTQVPESPRALADRHQRRAIHTETSVWVSASAGSGKTKVLTDRVLSLLLDGNEPQKILCLTFTKAAAAEMANRLAECLARWTAMGDRALGAHRLPRSGSNAPSVFLRRCSIPRGA
jgi:ATP-dependent helicase/nuclease subunit A